MAEADDIQKIIDQEKALVFPSFDEEIAFALGQRLRDCALKRGLAIIIDIRLWDRPLFYTALPGTSAGNADWARRKINSVRHFHKSSYRLFLETGDQVAPARHGLNSADYVFAGGAFPVRIGSIGAVGAVAVSGLPQREDHNFVVAGLCEHLQLDPLPLALEPA